MGEWRPWSMPPYRSWVVVEVDKRGWAGRVLKRQVKSGPKQGTWRPRFFRTLSAATKAADAANK